MKEQGVSLRFQRTQKGLIGLKWATKKQPLTIRQTIFNQCSTSITPENIRKPPVF